MLTFTLGGAFDLDGIHIWNGNQGRFAQDNTGRGVKSFTVSVSTNGTDFTAVLTNELTRSPFVNNNVGPINAQSFSLQGQTGITHVRLRVNSIHDPGNPYAALSEVMFTYVVDPDLAVASAFDFGSISILQTSEKAIPVGNTGATKTLNITKVEVTGDDWAYFTVEDFPATIAPGLDDAIQVTFDPVGELGNFSAVLEITSDSGGTPGTVTTVNLTATTTPDPGIVIAPSFNFGGISRYQTKQGGIPVANSGATQPLLITKVEVAGADEDYFQVDDFPASLAASADDVIHVTFDPAGELGAFSAVLEITSNAGGTPGAITTMNLAGTALSDPMISVPASRSFPLILPSATAQQEITVSNIGLTRALAISDVAVTGPDAARFTVDIFPSSIAAEESDIIAVTFRPNGADGNFAATLEIESNSGGVENTLTYITLTAQADWLAVLAKPAITAAAPALSPASNLFDGTTNQFVTNAGGAGAPFSQTTGTWVELDFGQPVALDRMILVTLPSTTAVVGVSRLILSADPTFDANDTVITFDPTGSNSKGPIQSFARTTARYARWEAGTSTGTSQNLGGMEMRFLDTPAGWFHAPVTVIGGATAFNADYALPFAVDGDAGRANRNEYASASRGPAMFVDFDLGQSLPIAGFDFFDRIPAVDRTTAFDLLFSDDPTFSTGVTALSFAPGSSGWGLRRSLPGVTARYIRFDATATTGPTNNSGIQEIIFYTSTEPPAGTPYEQYITTMWGLSGADAAPDFDYDGDGLDNAIEFVLGGDPTTSGPAIAPTQEVSDTHLTFTFRRVAAAASDNPFVQYGSDLTAWQTAVNGTAGIVITVTPNGFGQGIDRVAVAIPRALAPAGKLYARLAVEVALTE